MKNIFVVYGFSGWYKDEEHDWYVKAFSTYNKSKRYKVLCEKEFKKIIEENPYIDIMSDFRTITNKYDPFYYNTHANNIRYTIIKIPFGG